MRLFLFISFFMALSPWALEAVSLKLGNYSYTLGELKTPTGYDALLQEIERLQTCLNSRIGSQPIGDPIVVPTDYLNISKSYRYLLEIKGMLKEIYPIEKLDDTINAYNALQEADSHPHHGTTDIIDEGSSLNSQSSPRPNPPSPHTVTPSVEKEKVSIIGREKRTTQKKRVVNTGGGDNNIIIGKFLIKALNIPLDNLKDYIQNRHAEALKNLVKNNKEIELSTEKKIIAEKMLLERMLGHNKGKFSLNTLTGEPLKMFLSQYKAHLEKEMELETHVYSKLQELRDRAISKEKTVISPLEPHFIEYFNKLKALKNLRNIRKPQPINRDESTSTQFPQPLANKSFQASEQPVSLDEEPLGITPSNVASFLPSNDLAQNFPDENSSESLLGTHVFADEENDENNLFLDLEESDFNEVDLPPLPSNNLSLKEIYFSPLLQTMGEKETPGEEPTKSLSVESSPSQVTRRLPEHEGPNPDSNTTQPPQDINTNDAINQEIERLERCMSSVAPTNPLLPDVRSNITFLCDMKKPDKEDDNHAINQEIERLKGCMSSVDPTNPLWSDLYFSITFLSNMKPNLQETPIPGSHGGAFTSYNTLSEEEPTVGQRRPLSVMNTPSPDNPRLPKEKGPQRKRLRPSPQGEQPQYMIVD